MGEGSVVVEEVALGLAEESCAKACVQSVAAHNTTNKGKEEDARIVMLLATVVAGRMNMGNRGERERRQIGC